MRTSPLVLAALFAGGIAAAGPAFAPPPKPGPAVRKPASTAFTAQSLDEFAEAIMADKAGDLEKAENRYRRAADDAKQPALYYNLADVQRRMERYKDAIESYGKYLEAAPDAPDCADVEKLVEQLKATPPILTIDGDDPRAVVFVDGVLAGPSPQTVSVSAAPHVVDRIGPMSYEHDALTPKALDVRHLQSYGKDAPGNVILTASASIERGGGWRDGTRDWRLHERFQLAPGRYETRMFGERYLCSPVAFDVPKGDGLLYVFVDGGTFDRKDVANRGACIPITVRTKKVSFPP